MARREITLPDLPKWLPTKLPLEPVAARITDGICSIMRREPITNGINKIIEQIPIIPEKQYPTPFGTYKTPEFSIPELKLPTMDDRRREALKAAVIDDLSSLVEKIPVVGLAAGPISDAIEDTAMAKIHDTLTPKEYTWFLNYDKISPITTLAMLRALYRAER